MRTTSLLTLSLTSSLAFSQVIWDESINGDLSNDRLSPTNLQLALGSNTLTATSQQGDREYVHFHMGSGMTLNHIVLKSWQGTDQIGFIAVQTGSIFTEPPTGTNVANLLGYTHIGPGAGNLGSDFLPEMGQGSGAIGFTPPLTGEDYAFWIQQTGPSPVTYQLDFQVLPEPATLLVLSAGLAVLARKRRLC